MAMGMSAAMLLTGAGSALAATDGQTSIGTSIASGGNFDLSDTVAGDVITLGDATDTITIAGDTYNSGDIANWNTAFGWGSHGAAGYLVASNNLSDLGSAATARTNLGLGTAATSAATAFATAAQGTSADTAFGWGNHAAAGYLTASSTNTLTNKTLTSPVIAAWDGIYSSSGASAPVLAFYGMPGNVNYLEVGSGAGGGWPGLMAKTTGADANIGVNFGLKGTGAFVLLEYTGANNDKLALAPALGGAAQFTGTLSSADLTAARSWNLPDADGTLSLAGHTHAGYAASGANSDITSLASVATIDTINVSSTEIRFNMAGTIRSTTSFPMTLDSSGTGTVNVGTSGHTKAINIGTGTGGVATITLGNGTDGAFPDVFILNSSGLNVSAAGLITGASGNISQWTNDSGYAVSGANSDITSLSAVTSIDNAGSALNIGATNASSISIGRSGLGVGLLGGAYLGGNLKLLVQPGLTAFAGGGQASATALTGDVAVVTTVATPGDSVRLPVASPGMRFQVINRGANSLDIFPAIGESINALGVNGAYALPTLDSAFCVAIGISNWECVHFVR